MSLLGRIGIGAKVGIGLSLPIVLLIIVTAVSHQSLYAAKENFFEYRRLARQNNALGRVQANMAEIRLHATEFLLTGAAEAARLLRERANKLTPLISEARPLFEDGEALKTLTTIENDSHAFVNAFSRVVELTTPEGREVGEPGAATGERDRLVHDVLDRLGAAVDTALERMKLSNLARQDALGPRAGEDIERGATTAVLVSLLAILIGTAAAVVVSTAIAQPITAMTRAMRRLAAGELTVEIPARDHQDEVGAMACAVQVFKEALHRLDEQRRQRAEATDISTALQLAETPDVFGKALLERLAPLLGASLGLLYIRDAESGRFQVANGYACDPQEALKRSFAPGEGLPGQCVASGRTIVVRDLPPESHVIGSGLSAGRPSLLLCAPVAAREGILGVIELARYGEFTDAQREFLDLVAPTVGLNLGLLLRNLRTSALLEQTRRLAEELRAQTEELSASQEELRQHEEELQIANEALEEKTRSLERHTAELEAARAEADRRAAEVITASRYKSQFLANMSHELRTPLNSILLLADALAEDGEGKLSHDQLESVAMIGESGKHLLSLINDILDLSKIEAGKIELLPEDFHLEEAMAYVERVFTTEAERKGVGLFLDLAPSAPRVIHADRQRFTQVMINLIGNAVKFTERGEVRIGAEICEDCLRLRVRDSGVGIPADQIDRIFGAFQQLDGATSRRHGGTGLGLAICKSLAELMGGRIEATSTPGVGSVFSLILPLQRVAARSGAGSIAGEIRSLPWMVPPDAPILVVEPDQHLAAILRLLIDSLGCGFAGEASGEAALAAVARDPPAGILLDLDLPDGFDILRRLKASPEGGAIPVFVIASESGAVTAAKRLGAMGGIAKPIARDDVVAALSAITGAAGAPLGRRRVLVVEDNLVDARALEKLFRADAIDLVVARSGEEALHRLADNRFDAVILDLMLPDMSGFTLLERVCAEPGKHPPVIIYSAHDLSGEDLYNLRIYAESVVVKGRTQSRLREEVLQVIDAPPGEDEGPPHEAPARLKGLRLLLVDDDVRNLIALSKSLRLRGFEIEVAPDGGKALDLLAAKRFDALLTDIMMPGMDGYELIRRVRAAYAALPIIAATAKAMKGDAEKCLACGANGYLPKPLDLDNLLSMLARMVP